MIKKDINRMLDDIRSEVAYTRYMTGKETLRADVMAAMKEVPRDQFVPDELKPNAYENGPLPIGYGQTISQPFIVALMTDLLNLSPEHTVLEIGTGSGYQTAILSRLVKKVYSIELIAGLHNETASRLRKLEYNNIETRVGDGYEGWPENGPYDGIMVTAAAANVPQALIDQLKNGGNMVIPVGPPYGHQELMLIEKDMKGKLKFNDVLGVAFVPLVNTAHEENKYTTH